MDYFSIGCFVGKYLESHENVSARELQRMIISDPEVDATSISIDSILFVLDTLVRVSFLELVSARKDDECNAIYKRHVPASLQKKIERNFAKEHSVLATS